MWLGWYNNNIIRIGAAPKKEAEKKEEKKKGKPEPKKEEKKVEVKKEEEVDNLAGGMSLFGDDT